MSTKRDIDFFYFYGKVNYEIFVVFVNVQGEKGDSGLNGLDGAAGQKGEKVYWQCKQTNCYK